MVTFVFHSLWTKGHERVMMPLHGPFPPEIFAKQARTA
jgi:hypothetical protein